MCPAVAPPTDAVILSALPLANMSVTLEPNDLPPLGLAYLTTAGAHPVDQIKAAAAGGFAWVGLRLAAPIGLALDHPIAGHPKMLHAIKRAFADSGTSLLDVDALTITASTRVADFSLLLDATAELGGRIVQVVVEDPVRPRAVAAFTALCEAAAQRSLTVALEFMRWRAVNTIVDARRFLAESASQNGAICVDCLHLSRSGGRPEDLIDVPAAQVAYVQLCDAPKQLPAPDQFVAEARADRLFPGDGQLRLNDLLDQVAADVVLSVEAPRWADRERSARERAVLAGEATRGFLAQRHARSRAPDT